MWKVAGWKGKNKNEEKGIDVLSATAKVGKPRGRLSSRIPSPFQLNLLLLARQLRKQLG